MSVTVTNSPIGPIQDCDHSDVMHALATFLLLVQTFHNFKLFEVDVMAGHLS